MRPHLKAPPAGPAFGTPASIVPARLFALPLAMQAEGVRLLFEMGQTMRQVQERTGLSGDAITHLIRDARPFVRDDWEAS
ncbi:hypothetical protein [Aminobacter niigataensis]|uniref:hypothetical protein n=1 Tax=Aminobacter niigataensis TaxID=83265 RepID=UPI0024C5DD04|nr:hypothetical protein [Aminobacter niigataensis]CAI2936137.1 protein of unknown function [Aminobacter niigataensis]